METAVLEMSCTPPPFEIGSPGALFEPSSRETDLRRADERLIAELFSVLNRQLLSVIETRSLAEFSRVRKDVISKYIRSLRALQDTVTNLVSRELIERISNDVMVELASDLEKQGPSRFGTKLTEQALFSFWTMGKIRSLARQIESAGAAPSEKRKDDLDLVSQYYKNSLWAQFHLDVLLAAIKLARPICEEIREEICDGLRASVNAYAVMKEALFLRYPRIDTTSAIELPWDQEDEVLLAASMRDVNADFDC